MGLKQLEGNIQMDEALFAHSAGDEVWRGLRQVWVVGMIEENKDAYFERLQPDRGVGSWNILLEKHIVKKKQ